MVGKYQRKDGTVFDVIYGHKNSLQRANMAMVGKNRLFVPVTEAELQKELENKEITKVS